MILNKIVAERANLRGKVLRIKGYKGGNISKISNKRPFATKILKDLLNKHSFPIPTATEKFKLCNLTGLKLVLKYIYYIILKI